MGKLAVILIRKVIDASMLEVIQWLKQKREDIHLEREVTNFCFYLNRILFKERLILLHEQDDETYCRICSSTFSHLGEQADKKIFGFQKYKAKDEKIRQILKKSMNQTVLAVVVSASETGKDYYGFWLAGGSWHVYPREKLLAKKKFFT